MKQWLDVICVHYQSGYIKPVEIIWDNGVHYSIDRISKITKAASLKSGGVGLRYTCYIRQQPRYLFLENNKWFIEKIK